MNAPTPPPLAAVRAAYDRLACTWDGLFTRRRDVAENAYVLRRLRASGALRGRVLDVGCGTGLLLDLTALSPAQYVGVDVAPAMVARAREKYPGHTFVVGDAQALPLPAGDVDAVVSLFCATSYTDLGRAMREYRRVMRPGAALFLILYGRRNDGLNGNTGVYSGAPAARPPHAYYDRAAVARVCRGWVRDLEMTGLRYAALPDAAPVLAHRAWLTAEAQVVGRLAPDAGYFMLVTGRVA